MMNTLESADLCPYTSNIGLKLEFCKCYFDIFLKSIQISKTLLYDLHRFKLIPVMFFVAFPIGTAYILFLSQLHSLLSHWSSILHV